MLVHIISSIVRLSPKFPQSPDTYSVINTRISYKMLYDLVERYGVTSNISTVLSSAQIIMYFLVLYAQISGLKVIFPQLFSDSERLLSPRDSKLVSFQISSRNKLGVTLGRLCWKDVRLHLDSGGMRSGLR